MEDAKAARSVRVWGSAPIQREAPANAGVSLSLFITLYQSCALFQISVADDLLAARDELAQSLALKQTIGKKRQVSNLLEHFIL